MSDKLRTRYRPIDGVWITFPFAANYQAVGAPWQTPQYKISLGWVYLRGLMTRNTSNAIAGSVCGTMPAGARPLAQLLFEQDLTNARVGVQIAANGQVVHLDAALNLGGFLSLDGIQYALD